MLVLNVVKYSVIGLSLFFGTVNAMNLDDGKCAEIGRMVPREVISTAKGRNDERLKELLTKAAGNDGLLKEIVDYLGSAQSNSDEAHMVSSCMYYIYKDALKNSSDKTEHYDKVSELFGSIYNTRRYNQDYKCISLAGSWSKYNGTYVGPICSFETNQEYCF